MVRVFAITFTSTTSPRRTLRHSACHSARGRSSRTMWASVAGYSVREVIRTAEEISGLESAGEGRPATGGRSSVVPIADARQDSHRSSDGRPSTTELRAILETAWRQHKSHPNEFARVSS